MWTKLLAPALLATVGIASSADALSFDIQGGELVGAFGVDVGGTLYDVSFGDGTCAGLFNGCDDATDLDFQSEATAVAAAQALMDQVFVDLTSPSVNLDTDPTLTAGCSTASLNCQAFVPYRVDGIEAFVAFADNYSIEAADGVRTTILLSTFNTTAGAATFARFSPAAMAAVPLPATSLLLGGALIGFGGLARRRKT